MEQNVYDRVQMASALIVYEARDRFEAKKPENATVEEGVVLFFEELRTVLAEVMEDMTNRFAAGFGGDDGNTE